MICWLVCWKLVLGYASPYGVWSIQQLVLCHLLPRIHARDRIISYSLMQIEFENKFEEESENIKR